MNTRPRLAGEIGLFLLIMLVVVVAFFVLRPTDSTRPGSTSLAPSDIDGYYPPTSDQTPLPAHSATPRPTHTVPPDWPVYDPNARTNTPLPVVTPSIEPFPTQIFQFLPENTKEDGLFGFWYPYREGLNAPVSLEKISLNSNGQRTEKASSFFVVEALGINSAFPRIQLLVPSPKGDFFFIQTSTRDNVVFDFVRVSGS